jgi:hypothetical protein
VGEYKRPPAHDVHDTFNVKVVWRVNAETGSPANDVIGNWVKYGTGAALAVATEVRCDVSGHIRKSPF